MITPRRIFAISIILNVIAFVYAANKVRFKLTTPKPLTEADPDKAKIIILGDSRAASANWPIALNRRDVANLAKPGIYTRNVIEILDSAFSVGYRPKVAVIQVGINDLRRPGAITDSSAVYYRRLLCRLIQNDVQPVVTSTILIRKDVWQDEVAEDYMNRQVDTLNKRLRVMCVALNIPFIDLNQVVADHGRLKANMTSDGIHLNQYAYETVFPPIQYCISAY